MIVDPGIIRPGTAIYSSSKPQVVGNINKDGSISFLLDNQLQVFPYPSGAARAIAKLSVNDWKFWKILIDNDLKELSF